MFTYLDPRLRLKELQAGDILFVHRSSQSMGHGANRLIKSTGIPQLNQILSKPIPGVTTLDFSDPDLVKRVQVERLAYWQARVKSASDELGALRAVAVQYNAPYHQPSEELLQRLNDELDEANERLEDAKDPTNPPSKFNVHPDIDWRAVYTLRDWTCDGVLISVDDDVDVDDSDQPRVSRDDGVLLNVAIQGPTPMRNTNWKAMNMREGHEYEPQHIDASLAPLEKVFVGLFATQELAEDSTLERLTFQFRCFTGRQFASYDFGGPSAPASADTPDRDAPQNGPSKADFERLIGAWRVGSVLDNRLTADVERRVLINVCVEWWAFARLWSEYIDAEDVHVRVFVRRRAVVS